MSFFDSLERLPDDPILSLTVAFLEDPRETKVNLGVGSYKTSEGNPLVLTAVKKAETLLLEASLDKEYLPIQGDEQFIEASKKLVFGSQSPLIASEKIFGVQTIGASGALRLAGELLAQEGHTTIFVSDPSWPNHKGIFSKAGMKVASYPYYNTHSNTLDFSSMCATIKEIPQGSVILFHGGCHNPTGVDPSLEQWEELSQLVKQQQLIPLFDFAYQGFDEDPEQDAQAIRHFAEQEHCMFVASSHSKNFGLYGERIGLLSIATQSKETAQIIGSHIKNLARGNYSTPPCHGARIVKTVLTNEELCQEWQSELANMRERIKEMRKALMGSLLTKKSPKDFSFLNQQKGIFSFCGLTQGQVQTLRQENGIYMPNDGRINVAGLNWQNVDYVAEAIVSVL